MLTAYFRDIVSRYHRRAATPGEVRAAMAAEPSADLCPPDGLFLLARRDDVVIGCAGCACSQPGPERSPAFRRPRARRHGVGKQLLDAVEDAARQHAAGSPRHPQ